MNKIERETKSEDIEGSNEGEEMRLRVIVGTRKEEEEERSEDSNGEGEEEEEECNEDANLE